MKLYLLFIKTYIEDIQSKWNTLLIEDKVFGISMTIILVWMVLIIMN
jgi:hypothetical protein